MLEDVVIRTQSLKKHFGKAAAVDGVALALTTTRTAIGPCVPLAMMASMSSLNTAISRLGPTPKLALDESDATALPSCTHGCPCGDAVGDRPPRHRHSHLPPAGPGRLT